MKGSTRTSHFSLVELIAVLAIGLLVFGLVAVKLGRSPSFMTLDESARNIGTLLVTASRQAAATGRNMTVKFDREQRSFRIEAVAEEEDPSDTAPPYSAAVRRQFMTYALPTGIELDFPRQNDDSGDTFYLYPDGTGAGPETELKLRNKSLRLYLSPLTGSVIVDAGKTLRE
jgi:Tfp pilus assembly protein PilW